MGSISAAIAAAFRDFSMDGNAASGLHEIRKDEVRAIGPLIEAAIGNAALGSLIDVTKTTRPLLEADLAHAADTVALVFADPTAANNDIYLKTGSPGAGAWTKTTTLADAIAFAASPAISDAEAAALVAEQFAAVSRVKLVNVGEPQSQNLESPAATGFLMTSITGPDTRRSITRAADKITIAATQALAAGVLFEKADQKDGRLFIAEFKMVAGASTRAVGIGFTDTARAELARADATQTTAVDVDPVATNDTLLFALRQSGGAICVFQSTAGAPTTETTKIAFSSFTSFPVTWANDDTIRAVAWVPNDNTTSRRIDFFKKLSGATAFIWQGYILVTAANWPQGREMWAGAYSAGSFTFEVTATAMLVQTRKAEYPARRFMNASAAIIGLGTLAEPVSDLRQLFHSVDEGSDNLTAMIGANGGQPYRIVNSSGFSFPWDRFRELTLRGDAGAWPEIRGSILPVSAWVNVSVNVWKSPNRWNNQATTSNGAVICYDTSPLGTFNLPGTTTRMFRNAGLNVNAATLNAATVPSYSPQADGDMWIVLPGGQDPNSLNLELVQCGTMITFAGPSAAGLLHRPRLNMEDLLFRGGTVATLRLQVWDMLLKNVGAFGCLTEALLQEECSGETHGLRLGGTNADNHKANPYTGAGGASYYTDAARPTTYHWDAGMFAAGIAGDQSADNTSLHARGGRQVFIGGRFWDATKHNMSQIDSFEAHNPDCRRGAQGGIVAAFDANRSGDFAIMGGSVQDALVGGIQITRAAGSGTTRGIIAGTLIGRPTVATPVGILVTNSAGAGQIVFEDVGTRIDTGIATARQGYGSATVNQRTYA